MYQVSHHAQHQTGRVRDPSRLSVIDQEHATVLDGSPRGVLFLVFFFLEFGDMRTEMKMN